MMILSGLFAMFGVAMSLTGDPICRIFAYFFWIWAAVWALICLWLGSRGSKTP